MTASRRALSTVTAALGLLVFVVAIYGPGIGKGFVKDDVVWVGQNHVTSWADMKALMLRSDGFYRPVVAATFAFDRALHGVEPFGFGVTNLVLLVLCGSAIAYLGTTLGLSPSMGVVAAGVWALNFHAVNMAVLWLSGRTSLCVTAAATLAMAALVKGRPVAAGVAAFVAMLSKEEAVMLPLIFSAWAWLLGPSGGQPSVQRIRDVLRVTAPSWLALAAYVGLRSQTAAMTPMDASAPYQFVFSPSALAANALEYADRACTFSLMVLLVTHLLAWRRPRWTPAVARTAALAAIWMVGTYCLTILVPNRSSLYALLPSVGPALVAGVWLQQLWDDVSLARKRRLVAATVLLAIVLLPVYWSRNVRWTEIAELSADTFEVVRRVTREKPDLTVLVFRDDPSTRRSFANAYDQLLPEAARLAAGRRDITAQIEVPGSTSDEVGVLIVLKNGTVRAE